MPKTKREVEDKIMLELEDLETVNIALDGWSDRIQRSFTGYLTQAINSKWEMTITVIAFEYMHGRHTAENIKKQFDQFVERFKVNIKT